jgi:hypothetical protein
METKASTRAPDHIFFKYTKYSRNVKDVDWELVVKLALPGKVTRRAYKVFAIYDRFLTSVQFSHNF